MVESDPPRVTTGHDDTAPVPWTPRRKRIVRCLGRAGGTTELGGLLDCCVEAGSRVDDDPRNVVETRVRRQVLEVDIPVLEGYGVVRWEDSDRLALTERYAKSSDGAGPSWPWTQPVRPYFLVAAVLAVVVVLRAATVPPFASFPPLWYAVVAIAALVVLPYRHALFGRGQ